MNIRKFFFWFHLIIGCSAALFIFLMSLTGAALTYERQMIKAAVKADYPTAPTSNSQALSLDQLINIAHQFPAQKTPSIALTNDKGAIVEVKDGRKTIAYLNPYTGETMAPPGAGTKRFLKKLRAFHRWLTLDGSFSESGRWVNGISNVIFSILILSGIYLWLPKRFTSRAFKHKLVLTKQHSSVKARDYQWHNVFGFYIAPVLFLLVITAFFFSFKWPGQTLKNYASTHSVIELPSPKVLDSPTSGSLLSQQQLLNQLQASYPQWQSIRFSLPKQATDIQIFTVDNGNGGEPHKSTTVAVSRLSGEAVAEQSFEQRSEYRKIRSYIRFLHTGEVFGLTGQTIAGVVSLVACLLVYTGAMLSIRRWRNANARKAQTAIPQAEIT